MKDIGLLSETFRRKNALYEEIFCEEPDDGGDAEIVLRFKAEVKDRVEEYFEDDSITVTDEGDLLVGLRFPEDEWVYSMILSYGDNVEVVKPHYIRTIIREKAEKIRLLYTEEKHDA